jgi:hypothetical protein
MIALLESSLEDSSLSLSCDFDAIKYTAPLSFSPTGKTSKFLSLATHSQVSVLETKPFTYYSQQCAVPVDQFKGLLF